MILVLVGMGLILSSINLGTGDSLWPIYMGLVLIATGTILEVLT